MASDVAETTGLGPPFPIPADWEGGSLAEYCEFIRDGDWIETKDQGGNDYRLLQISNIGRGNFVETGKFRWITSEAFARLRCTAIEKGDVLVARMPEPTGRAWHVITLSWPAVTAVDVAIIRTDRLRLDPQFLSYFLNSGPCLALIDSLTTGTTRRRIRRADIERLTIPLPPLPEQRAIADVLGALDDKIALNERMNATLEEMARALFRSWFVDFEPVRAKAEGRPSGLPPALDALFPASFEPSELGPIPAGWEVQSLDDIAHFTNGLALQRFPPEGDEWLPVIKIAEMRRGYTDRTAKASANIDSRYIVEDGDVLFSWSGSLDLVLWAHGPGALNQHLFKVTSDEYARWFYWSWTREHLDEFRAIAAGKATTMGHIQRHHLTDAKVAVPPMEVLRTADTPLAGLVDQHVGLAAASHTLAELRDALLPKLVSGEVRVRHRKS